MIHSIPSGAKVYLNNEPVGTTPYEYTDTKIVGSTNYVKLTKEGYDPLHSSFSRNEEADVGAIVAGVFVVIPLLWAMKYKPSRTYELFPETGKDSPKIELSTEEEEPVKSKAERLRELKELLDEKIITQKEFETEKKKILEE